MRGRGYMTAAVRAVIPFVFDSLELHRLEAACLPANAASIKLLERTGFTREGMARRYLKINGVWQDHLLYALLESDSAPLGADRAAIERRHGDGSGPRGESEAAKGWDCRLACLAVAAPRPLRKPDRLSSVAVRTPSTPSSSSLSRRRSTSPRSASSMRAAAIACNSRPHRAATAMSAAWRCRRRPPAPIPAGSCSR